MPVLVDTRGCVNASPGRAPGEEGGEAIGASLHREEPMFDIDRSHGRKESAAKQPVFGPSAPLRRNTEFSG